MKIPSSQTSVSTCTSQEANAASQQLPTPAASEPSSTQQANVFEHFAPSAQQQTPTQNQDTTTPPANTSSAFRLLVYHSQDADVNTTETDVPGGLTTPENPNTLVENGDTPSDSDTGSVGLNGSSLLSGLLNDVSSTTGTDPLGDIDPLADVPQFEPLPGVSAEEMKVAKENAKNLRQFIDQKVEDLLGGETAEAVFGPGADSVERFVDGSAPLGDLIGAGEGRTVDGFPVLGTYSLTGNLFYQSVSVDMKTGGLYYSQNGHIHNGPLLPPENARLQGKFSPEQMAELFQVLKGAA